MKDIQNKPELLAPAGNLESALAAYASGADAVYCGLGKYNAREMADNFSFDDMSRLSAYAKKHNKRFYLTFNTLLKQGELAEAAEQLYSMTRLAPDAVIVQDIGIVRMLREFFPALPIHASTQMGIHNSAGIKTAAEMGMERVILERQVTVDELEQITARSEVEIEVFVHGALCCSLSGKCLFSSWIGGWSGNRGRCKQPCRRRYYAEGRDGKKAGFFFSTQDLYTLDLIPQLKRIGVASLKIEGRLKKPSYVQSVVQAYRMVLDSDETAYDRVIGQAKQVLAGSYGRKWSHGFATAEDMSTVLQPENVGVSGLLIGSVKGSRPGKLTVEVQRKLHIGDRIRFQSAGGEESSGFTVRTLEQRGSKVRSVPKGEVQIPFDREVAPGSKVYKVSQSIKKNWPDPESLPLLKIYPRIDLEVAITRNRISVKTAEPMPTGGKIEWTLPLELEDAKKHGISAEEVERVFSASGDYSFTVGSVEVHCEEGLFMPPSLLKQVRREFWEYLAPLVQNTDAESLHLQQLNQIASQLRLEQQTAERSLSSEHREISCAGKPGTKAVRRGVQVDSLYSFSKQTREVELPHFCPEPILPLIKKKIDQAVELGIRRFRVTDLYQIELLGEHTGLTLTAAYPLPVSNPLAAAELKRRGIEKVQAWVELDREGFSSLRSTSPLPVELYRYGRPFLLATRAKVDAEGEISDPRGRKFYVKYAKDEHLTYIYPYEMLKLPQLDGFDEFYDYRHSFNNEHKVSSFNFETEFV